MDDQSFETLIDNLKESVNIAEHLSFINSLLNKYTWQGNRRNKITNDLSVIRQKQNDTNLYLAVVGEFNSGKSSLINALIRDDLLKADVIQATTAAATMIQYHERLDIEVKYNDGNIETYESGLSFSKKFWRSIFPPSLKKIKKEVREYIYKVTVDEEIACAVQKVIIRHPSDILKNGLIIIDTPGTDVNNPRHETVTKNTIRELSDAAIIVIQADKPVPQSLINFIDNNLRDVLSRCIFIVTKMDLIRTKERVKMIEFIKQRLQTAFNIRNVNVFVLSSILVLEDTQNNEDYIINNSIEEKYTLLEQSYHTEKQIYRILNEQRVLIQLQKLVTLIKTMFGELEDDLKSIEKSYTEKHAALEKNRITDLSLFIQKQKQKHRNEISQNSIPIQQEINELVDSTRDDLLEQINREIFNIPKEGELKKFIKNRLEEIIKISQSELSDELSNLFEKFRVVGEEQVSIFEAEFKKLYISLATLGGTITVDEARLGNETSLMISQSFSQQVVGVKELVKSENKKSTLTTLGSTGAGALIGTMILPGIGTIVGYTIGALASLFFRKSLIEQQKMYFIEIEKALNESFDLSLLEIEESTDDTIHEIIGGMDNIIDNYFSNYDQLVKEMIRRDEEEKRELTRKTQIIKEDLAQLANRQSSLESIRERLVAV